MPEKKLILIAEDDKAIATGLSMNLELEGYATCLAEDGIVAEDMMKSHHPVLVLLDIGMPRKDGLEVLRDWRASGISTPVIVLSARLSESDKVAALKLGADDYVTKPFALAELMARVGAVLRRSQSDFDTDATSVTGFGDVLIDRDLRTVVRNGRNLQLTNLEFSLLCYFLDNPMRVLEREQILDKVWGTSGTKRTVDNFVAQLRAKLEADPESPKHFLTVRGIGYRFQT